MAGNLTHDLRAAVPQSVDHDVPAGAVLKATYAQS